MRGTKVKDIHAFGFSGRTGVALKRLPQDLKELAPELRLLLRFAEVSPVSHVTAAFPTWICHEMAAEQKVLVLIWDTVSWNISRELRT